MNAQRIFISMFFKQISLANGLTEPRKRMPFMHVRVRRKKIEFFYPIAEHAKGGWDRRERKGREGEKER